MTEQCLRSCGTEFQMWAGPKQVKMRVLCLQCSIFTMRVSEDERSVRDGVYIDM